MRDVILFWAQARETVASWFVHALHWRGTYSTLEKRSSALGTPHYVGSSSSS
jgi:hypothetical protein